MALLLLLLLLGPGPGPGPSFTSAQILNPQAIVQRNYNMARVAGTWYSISMASDNLTWVQEQGDLRLFVRRIEYLGNGSLKFNFRFRVQGECVIVAVVCERTEKNGEFSIAYQGQNKLQVVETDYRLFIIFYLHNTRADRETQVLALYGGCSAPTHRVRGGCGGSTWPLLCPQVRWGARGLRRLHVAPPLSPGRNPEMSSAFLNRFEQACRRYGLSSRAIIHLTSQDQCFYNR
ncbi:epididymal-specific lipocalin-9-like [Oryctolagus cuniculus]|uniref:epididymal-specific lipocalin-9-like n=1 Tax=Oryctolagus cuniculus TaxID=9986 RepID=UPI003879C2C3